MMIRKANVETYADIAWEVHIIGDWIIDKDRYDNLGDFADELVEELYKYPSVRYIESELISEGYEDVGGEVRIKMRMWNDADMLLEDITDIYDFLLQVALNFKQINLGAKALAKLPNGEYVEVYEDSATDLISVYKQLMTKLNKELESGLYGGEESVFGGA